MLVQITPDQFVDERLNHFQPYLDRLVDTMDGEVTADAIITAIKNGTIALAAWVMGQEFGCYLILERQETATGDALIVSGVVGDTFGDYEPFHQACVNLAKELNCNSIKMRGRRGLWKKYRELGYKESYSIYTFNITPEPPSYDCHTLVLSSN